MSRSSRETIQALYNAFATGDVPAVMNSFDPGIIWNEAEGSPYSDRNPYVGPQQIGEGLFARLMADFEGFSVMPETLLQDGDNVAAIGRYAGMHRGTGQALRAQFVHVWTVRDGKVTRFQQYTDTAQWQRVSGAMAGAGTVPV